MTTPLGIRQEFAREAYREAEKKEKQKRLFSTAENLAEHIEFLPTKALVYAALARYESCCGFSAEDLFKKAQALAKESQETLGSQETPEQVQTILMKDDDQVEKTMEQIFESRVSKRDSRLEKETDRETFQKHLVFLEAERGKDPAQVVDILLSLATGLSKADEETQEAFSSALIFAEKIQHPTEQMQVLGNICQRQLEVGVSCIQTIEQMKQLLTKTDTADDWTFDELKKILALTIARFALRIRL